MGQSLEKQKEGFPRDRRFRDIPLNSSRPSNRYNLRQPWAFCAQVYRFLFVREGPSLRETITARIGSMVDRTIYTSYRSVLALTAALHAALLVYGGVTWNMYGETGSSSMRDWLSSDSFDSLAIPESSAARHIFSYVGGSWEHDYALVERILSSATRRRLGAEETKTLTEEIVTTAQNHRVDPVFIASLIRHESGFRRSVVSSAGAIGLMQLLPSTGQFVCALRQAPWRGSQRLCSPAYNLQLGITYLKYLLKRFSNNLSHTLIAYNWGPGNLQRAIKHGRAIPRGPVGYARSILRDYERARRLHGVEIVSVLNSKTKEISQKKKSTQRATTKHVERLIF